MEVTRVMVIIGRIEQSHIDMALDATNAEFAGNIRYKRFEPIGQTRQGEKKFRVTLTVLDSAKLGARRAVGLYTSGRRVAAACWHVHGTFIDALPKGTRVQTTCGQLGTVEVQPGNNWHDYSIGSIMHPCFASEACECDQ